MKSVGQKMIVVDREVMVQEFLEMVLVEKEHNISVNMLWVSTIKWRCTKVWRMITAALACVMQVSSSTVSTCTKEFQPKHA